MVTAMPPGGVTPVPFECPPDAVPVERRLWSQIDPSRPKDRKLIQQLKAAYCELRSRDYTDPTSLYFQARLHGWYCAHQDIHRTWAFLPWHRGFIYFHEQILAATKAVNHDPDFRLPVWDWERSSKIPRAFQELGLPDFLTGSYARTSTPIRSPITNCIQQAWLMSERFEDFCGYQSCTSGDSECLPHSAGGPHSIIHSLVVSGAMAEPHTSAADPTFYGHHANVDRFWAHWLKRYAFDTGKDLPAGWGAQTYYFYNPEGKLVQVTADQLLNHRKLGYDYTLPGVKLCDTNARVISIAATTAASLGASLRETLLALAMGGFQLTHTAVVETMKFWAGLLKGKINLGSLLDPTCWMSIPVHITAVLPTKYVVAGKEKFLKAGKYYVVQLSIPGATDYAIGGFGIFMAPHHLHQVDSIQVAITACVDTKVASALVGDLPRLKDWQLVYRESPDGLKVVGERHVIVNASVKMFCPKGWIEKGSDLIKTLHSG